MRKQHLVGGMLALFLLACSVYFILSRNNAQQLFSEEEHEGYDGPMERGYLEWLKTKDPATDIVPEEKLWNAMTYTESMKQSPVSARISSFAWQERGPVYDSVGPSNGNDRGTPTGQVPGAYTSGRIISILVDAADATGNTVWTGGVAGGLWKTTNFLNASPNWQPVNDFFDNLAITSITQDPSNTNTIYFCTGEATSNSDAVFGKGIWKSTDHGATWNQLPSTTSFNRNFKMMCDAAGNVYLASRAFGLRRSINGGSTWVDISPSGITATNATYCTDIELAANGRLFASFGYTTSSAGGTIQVRFTDNPSTVTSIAGWQTPVGLTTSANRIELAARGDTLYAAPSNAANAVVAIYRSFDRGANWTRANAVDYPSPINIASTQAWYDLALEISPVNGLEFMVGGLDAHRSLDGGATVVRNTYWVQTPPYVHADHHNYRWMVVGAELRLIMATDGGLFLSRDNGLTYSDRNRNIGIKQFYSGTIHPLRENYLLAGAQDNGSHQINNPGKTYSIEVTGGDGAYVAIDQKNPNFQFTSYVYNQYRRSTNDGTSWSSFNFSGNRGFFINPFLLDDSLKIMYASFAVSATPNKSIFRWNNPTTATSITNASRDTIVINSLMKGSTSSNASAFLVSPYTPKRLYVGGSNGSLVRIDNANTVTNATVDANTTVLTGASFPSGYINCIAVGSTENHLLAVFSNYGITNLWYSSDGGTSWTGIDGNLPDMPVRWAIFHPESNTRLIIATETGVWTTNEINGSGTAWIAEPTFPNVRTDMLKLRKSDNVVVAATHGRGLWTASISSVLPIKNITLSGSLQGDGKSLLQWATLGETPLTRYAVEYSTDGVQFSEIGNVAYNVKTYSHAVPAQTIYYRIVGTEPSHPSVYSNTITIRNTRVKGMQVKILPNPVNRSSVFTVTSSSSGMLTWSIVDAQGRSVRKGQGSLTAGVVNKFDVNAAALASGTYRFVARREGEVVIESFIKQ
jgi:hypothetical protein